MRHLTAALILAAAAASVQAGEPVYVLEYPGLAFEWLPAILDPPVEGSITEEDGAIASTANSQGVEFHFHYWQEDMSADDRSGDWLEQRLDTVLPESLPGILNMGGITWSEGSMKSSNRDHASVGLVVSVNFNFITDSGSVLAAGKAYAVFLNGYSVLLYGIAPAGVWPSAGQVLDEIVALSCRID